jgi:hypothetical protein
LVLLSLDLGWWRSPTHEWELRNAVLHGCGLPESNLIIHLTHTHSGPSLNLDEFGEVGGFGVVRYLKTLTETLVTLIRDTMRSEEWSILEWIYGWCPVAHIRDVREAEQGRFLIGVDSEAASDQIVLVGRISGLGGVLRGTIVNYACHPTTLGWQNRLLSPDYPGPMRELVQSITKAPCVFLQGTSGNQGPRFGFTGDVAAVEMNGHQLGYSVLSVLSAMDPPGMAHVRKEVVEVVAPFEVKGHVAEGRAKGIRAGLDRVSLPLRSLPAAEDYRRQANECSDPVEVERLRRAAQICALGEGKDTLELRLWHWRVGQAVFIGSPIEAYIDLQFALRGATKQKVVVTMNLINGWYGYLPPKEWFRKDVHSVKSTIFAVGSYEIYEERAIQAVRDSEKA